MKFYFVELTHLQSGIAIHKFGVTHHSDVLRRFNPIVDKRWNDFSIRALFSIDFNTDIEAYNMEQNYLKKYPKNFNLENTFGSPNNYFDNLSGITETCILGEIDRYNTLNDLFSFKKNYK